jgi:tRNA threonylcarbamoyladenosine biosynthesis protein TsaB
VAVALGPGSFTSLRIGLALAKGLALALNIPIVGVPTLDILVAAQQLRDIPLAAVLQAGRNRLAVGWYGATRGRWQAQGEASVFTVEELAEKIAKPTLVCGELNALQRQVLAHKHKNVLLATPAQSLRRPSYLAEIGWKHWQSGKVDDVVSLAPIYLHVVEAIPA